MECACDPTITVQVSTTLSNGNTIILSVSGLNPFVPYRDFIKAFVAGLAANAELSFKVANGTVDWEAAGTLSILRATVTIT